MLEYEIAGTLMIYEATLSPFLKHLSAFGCVDSNSPNYLTYRPCVLYSVLLHLISDFSLSFISRNFVSPLTLCYSFPQ